MSITFIVDAEPPRVKRFMTELYPELTEEDFNDGFSKKDPETGRFYEMVSEWPEPNVSNTNAVVYLKLLGLEFDYCGTISHSQIPEIKRRAISVINSQKLRESETREIVIDRNWVECSLDEERIQRYMEAILKVLDVAQKEGHDVSWA